MKRLAGFAVLSLAAYVLLSFALLEWAHWIMQVKQFAELKRRAECRTPASVPA